jgi:histidine triad (HIT) family protein
LAFGCKSNARAYALYSKFEVDKILIWTKHYLGLMHFAKECSYYLRKNSSLQRLGIAVVGLEVPHTHVHLIPLNGWMKCVFKIKFFIGRI